jgi:AcrR family transcriptional regulator
MKLRGSPRLTAEERRLAILGAAKRVFAGAGYHEATTRDIAAAAGVSEALLYQHFPGKRQLFEEVVESAARELEERLRAAQRQPDPPAAGVAAYFDFVEAESELYRVFFQQALQADPAFRRLYLELAHRFVRLLEADSRVSEVGVHALAGMITELPKREIVERAGRMARAICERELEDGRDDRG